MEVSGQLHSPASLVHIGQEGGGQSQSARDE